MQAPSTRTDLAGPLAAAAQYPLPPFQQQQQQPSNRPHVTYPQPPQPTNPQPVRHSSAGYIQKTPPPPRTSSAGFHQSIGTGLSGSPPRHQAPPKIELAMQGLCINTNGHPQQQQPTQPTPVSKQLPPLPGQSSPPIVAPNNLVLPHLGSQSSFSDELGSFLKPQSPPLVPAKDATQAVPGPTVTSPSSAASNAQVFFAFTESTVSDSVASGPQYLGNGSNVSAPPSAAPRTSLESASSGSLRASSSTHSTHPSHTSGYTHGTVVSSQAQPQSHGQDNGRSRGSTEGVAPHSTNPPQQPACGPSPVAQPTMTALPSQTSFAPLPSLPPTMHTPQQQYQPLSPQQQYQQPPPQLYHQSPQQQYQVPQYQQQYQQPVQQPYQQPYQQPVQQPYQQPMQYQQPVQPYQQPVQQPYQQPVQQPYQQPVQQPYQQPMQYQQQYQPYQQPVQQHPYQPQQPYQALPPQPVVPGVYSPPATQGMSPSNSTGSMNSIVSTTTSPPLPPAVRAPSPLAMADRSGLHPGRASMSSDDSRVQHLRSLHQSHLRAASVSGAGTARSPSPLSQPSKPLPAAKSEDWGALVDAPESPTQSFHNNGRFPSQRSFLMGPGYTDSPAEETVHSADYMQHVSQPPQQSQTLPYSAQPQQPKPTPRHAQTDPSPTQHRPSFHQHHNSVSGIPFATNSGPSDSMVRPGRQSWSPNTQLEAPKPLNGNNPGGFRPPLRRPDGSPGVRSGAHSKQSSVATSISLLNDTAIVAKYREAAIKTNDPTLQLSYAKYLLEIGEPSETFTPIPEQAGGSNSNGGSGSSSPTLPESPETMGKRQLTQEAIYWIERLAKEGQSEAQFIRGTWCEDGLYGNKKNHEKALKHFQSASKGDYAPAHFRYGSCCEKKKDNNKAVVLFKKGATHNDVPCNYRLAIVYLYGELGQTKNLKTGLQYLKRAASFASEESPMPPYVLGLILAREYKQLSIPDDIAFPDDKEAFEWFKKAADLGYGPANYKLGYCYEYGTLGCNIDPFQSVDHYERAVVAGDGNGEAEMALSGWYLSGSEGCFEANDGLAFQYASKAAEKKLPKAQYAMGYYHEVGISIPIDIDKAMEYYKLAAAAGNKEAQQRLSGRNTFDKSGHTKSIKRIKQSRVAKDTSCIVM